MENDLPSLAQIESARDTIKGSAIRTPLVKLNLKESPAEIYLKLENLQPIGSFKIRGATNAIGHLSPETLARGVLTASAGNMAQGVAWRARELEIPCTVVAPDTAPDTKVKAVERLGGRVIKVPFEEWWRAFETRTFPGVDATFIHAFDDVNDGRQWHDRARDHRRLARRRCGCGSLGRWRTYVRDCHRHARSQSKVQDLCSRGMTAAPLAPRLQREVPSRGLSAFFCGWHWREGCVSTNARARATVD